MKRTDYWTPDDIATLHQLARTHSAKQIAKLLNRTPTAVGVKARKLKIRMRKHGENHASAKFSDATVNQAIDLIHRGYSSPEISAATGMSASHIVNIRNGYTRTRG